MRETRIEKSCAFKFKDPVGIKQDLALNSLRIEPSGEKDGWWLIKNKMENQAISICYFTHFG